ncbi:response regulator [Christiangramia sp. OXR-203]|jgi:CheY-like chemotaxis protein|uniref:response regulator n=1 Tax=Christiangramia sp. OXR-203 TaxID=3100176 RepID=UPI002AC98F98|nr:response regulator [Christiangramia sp. OXR-203]WPY99743.1 response regulator [Christiangramia sp. OXR-203]
MLRTIIIDDDDIVTFLQKKIVSKSGLDTDPLVFKDAHKALEFLEYEASEDQEYLIMLDINMPAMSGWEFLDHIKKLPSDERLHVVMATSSIDRKDKREAANDPHVVDFIEKPLSARHCEKLKGISKLAPYFQLS